MHGNLYKLCFREVQSIRFHSRYKLSGKAEGLKV